VEQDERARFEDLYRDSVRRLFAYVLTRTNRANAHDVVADTYVVAWRRRHDIPPDALPWLIGAARRVLADQGRSQDRRSALRQRLEARTRLDQRLSDGVGDSIVLRDSIRQALSQLRPGDRDVVILAAWHGFEAEQLAVALGCSKSVASLRLHRARRRFAAILQAQDDPSRIDRRVIRPAKEAP
jgi:RNA polymerase sigma factor (sigma-70 family)